MLGGGIVLKALHMIPIPSMTQMAMAMAMAIMTMTMTMSQDEIGRFWPGSKSTPAPDGEEVPMQTMQHQNSGLPDTFYDEIPSLEGFGKLGPIGFSKTSGNETTIVSLGPKGSETEIFKKDASGLLKKITDNFKTFLRPDCSR